VSGPVHFSVQQAAQVAHKGGVAAATGGGLWLWLAENQQAIAALGVVVGIVLGVAGFAVNWWYLHRKGKRA
jgi:hypothetical protein